MQNRNIYKMALNDKEREDRKRGNGRGGESDRLKLK